MSTKEHLAIDRELSERLSVIAEREGSTLSELAENVLRQHAEEAERLAEEFAEDDRRWAKYLETGESISLEDILSNSTLWLMRRGARPGAFEDRVLPEARQDR